MGRAYVKALTQSEAPRWRGFRLHLCDPGGAILVTFCCHLSPNTLEYEQIVLRAKVYEGAKWRRKSKKREKRRDKLGERILR